MMGESGSQDFQPPQTEQGQQIPLGPEAVPGQAAQELGGTAVEHVAAEPESVEPVTQTLTDSTPQELDTRIADVDLAHEMANHGYTPRVEAAETRRDIKAEKQFKDDLSAILSDPRYEDTSLRRRILTTLALSDDRPLYMWGQQLPYEASSWAKKELRKLEERVGTGGYLKQGTENKDIGFDDRYNPIGAAEEVIRGEYDPNKPFRESDEAYARRMDEIAERREEWARILYEKPVSDEYKEQHPDYEFGVLEMVELEKMVDEHDGLKYYQESYLGVEHLDDSAHTSFDTVLSSLHTAVEKLVQRASEAETKSLLEEYQTRLTDRTTTLADLMELNKTFRTRHNELLRAKADERRRVLSDVKSGRASQTTQPAAEVQFQSSVQ